MKRRSLFQSLLALPLFAWFKPVVIAAPPVETVRYEMEERHIQKRRTNLLESVRFEMRRSFYRIVKNSNGIITSYCAVWPCEERSDTHFKLKMFDAANRKEWTEEVYFEPAPYHFSRGVNLYRSVGC